MYIIMYAHTYIYTYIYLFIYNEFSSFFWGERYVLIQMVVICWYLLVCDSCVWFVLSFLDCLGVGVVGHGFFWSLGCLLLFVNISAHNHWCRCCRHHRPGCGHTWVGPSNRLGPSPFVGAKQCSYQLGSHELPLGYQVCHLQVLAVRLHAEAVDGATEAPLGSGTKKLWSGVLIFPSWRWRKEWCSFQAFLNGRVWHFSWDKFGLILSP